MNEFDRENPFSNIDIYKKKVEILNELILNVFTNYCPSKTVISNLKDPPRLAVELKL